jgi:hypothetical protein
MLDFTALEAGNDNLSFRMGGSPTELKNSLGQWIRNVRKRHFRISFQWFGSNLVPVWVKVIVVLRDVVPAPSAVKSNMATDVYFLYLAASCANRWRHIVFVFITMASASQYDSRRHADMK